MSVYRWPWNDDDRSWIPDVLDSGILWSTNTPTIDVGEGELIIKSVFVNNSTPKVWSDQGKENSSWENADSNPSTEWTEVKEQEDKWNQT
jgi:hypothetical protein